MPLVPFPAYTPDVVDYERNSSLTITGVVPRADGYGPVPSPTVYSQALGGNLPRRVRGLEAGRHGQHLRRNQHQALPAEQYDAGVGDVSKGAGTYTAVNPAEQWQFAQFGNFVIAVQANTTPQFYDLGTPTAFADLSTATGALGTAPSARYV